MKSQEEVDKWWVSNLDKEPEVVTPKVRRRWRTGIKAMYKCMVCKTPFRRGPGPHTVRRCPKCGSYETEFI